MVDREVFVVGGANSAGQAALHLADFARRVTLVIRADSLAKGMAHYLVQQVAAAPNIDVRIRTEVVGGGGEEGLEHLELRSRGSGVGGTDGPEGATTDGSAPVSETVPADALFLMIGARPNTDWLPAEILRDAGGFIRTGATLAGEPGWEPARAPFSLETSMPGVFAVGDVRNGSMSRVAAAVGEGSIAVRLVHELFAAERLGAPQV
jgi:thioredoxin reductase (NADPH)